MSGCGSSVLNAVGPWISVWRPALQSSLDEINQSPTAVGHVFGQQRVATWSCLLAT